MKRPINNCPTCKRFLGALAAFILPCSPAAAELIGQWTFEDNETLTDKAGNFPDLLLMDDAEIANGALKVTGSGTNATGWAITDSDGGEYTGPEITSKTLVSWATLDGLEDVAKAGSVITIDRIRGDIFDGIIFAEREFNRWMNGSSGFQRTMDLDPGFEEDTPGELLQMAISYEDLGDGFMTITVYRNGEEIGTYDDEPASFWDTGDAEIIFGKRHGSTAGGPGGLEATIEEARIYDEVLTKAQIAALTVDKGVDEDEDGLSDEWENEHFGNLAQLASGDPDADGLENLDEQKRSTDPNDDDSDNDTLKDGVETKTGTFVSATNTGTDPLDDDTDDDTLKDNVETGTGTFVSATNTGTDPNNEDSDGDRRGDGEEIAAGSNPNDPNDPPSDPLDDDLLGRWTFEDGEQLVDIAGNFPDLLLQDDAEIKDGKLIVTGSGTNATGWAVTGDGGDYEGPPIEDKTLVSWCTLDTLEDDAKAGSVITIDRLSGDHFDGIIFAERQFNAWMNGSSGFQRTIDFDNPGFEEEEAGIPIMMAITYEYIDDGAFLNITGYRRAEGGALEKIGEYEDEPVSFWDEGDAEIFFGKRHGSVGGGPGGLNATIEEARIYGRALTEAEVGQLGLGPSPIGQWTFEPGEELEDRAGLWNDLELKGDATIANGKLNVNGSGNVSSGWAATTGEGDYEGEEPIGNKTLMAWLTLEGLSNAASAGSAITIDTRQGDLFDGIIFGEREANRWMNGSNGFQRTPGPGFDAEEAVETETGNQIHVAITYEGDDDGNVTITGYRNGEPIGQYEDEPFGIWEVENVEMIFGKRHGDPNSGAPGALDAQIEEARLYDLAIPAAEIKRIYLGGPVIPEDRDGDGLSDRWENLNFGNLAQAADGDPDDDQSPNIREQTAETDPNNPDTDEDGVKDGPETNTGTFVSAVDTGTDPLNPDSDEDGLKDNVETGTKVFVDANNTGTNPNLRDSDGDRLLDAAEVAAGTNPNDANSPPAPPKDAFLVGHWTFEPGEETTDLTRNFPELLLVDTAEVTEDGKLDVNADGWAVTNSDEGEYLGPEITNKTLVAWVIMQDLDVRAGSVITIDKTSSDIFDGIIFAERQPNQWMAGSSNFRHTENFDPGFEEDTVDELIKVAITYEDLDGSLQVTGYREPDGGPIEELGQYEKGEPFTWEEGDAEVFFGKRHGSTGGGPGSLDVLIEEARIYNEVFSRKEIEDLTLGNPSIFQVTEVVVDETAKSISVTWTSSVGATYVIESSEDVQLWTELTDGYPDGGATGDTTTIVIEPIPDGTTEFYVRIKEE